jgi:hypothetical protein
VSVYEKVLYTAIKAIECEKNELEKIYNRKLCIAIYTGDNDVSKEEILEKIKVFELIFKVLEILTH